MKKSWVVGIIFVVILVIAAGIYFYSQSPKGGECSNEGQIMSDTGGNSIINCCEGLEKISVYDETNLQNGKCILPPDGVYVCTRCGDGNCGTAENKCNCPADCK